MKVRFNIRINEDLLSWLKEYASEKNTTSTQVIVDLLTKLKEEREAENAR